MGYETKLIIGELQQEPNEKKVILEIASIKLSNACFSDTFITAADKVRLNECVIYVGDKEIKTDSYGSKLYALDPEDVLLHMISANLDQHNRRVSAAIPLLQSLIKGFANSNLRCVLFGY